MNVSGTSTISRGTERFTYSPGSKTVQIDEVVAGKMQPASRPVTASGDEISFENQSISYKLNLKSLVLNIRHVTYDATDGNLVLSGTGKCSAQ
jgi:hypothetical protein